MAETSEITTDHGLNIRLARPHGENLVISFSAATASVQLGIVIGPAEAEWLAGALLAMARPAAGQVAA